MEQIISYGFHLTSDAIKCQVAMRNIDYPRITYAVQDMYMHTIGLLKRISKTYTKLNKMQYEHLKFQIDGICNMCTSILSFLENHKMFHEFNVLELSLLKLKSV